MKRKRMAGAAVFCLLTLAAAVRIYIAWLNRNCTDPDFAIVGLMAKHIAEAREFPLLLYGYGYGGSFESIVGALFFKALGPGSFALSLATAACAFPGLVFVYLWTRDLVGRAGGLRALSLLVVGPWVFIAYSVKSVCGYAVILSLIPLLFWLTFRTVSDERSGVVHGWLRYFLFGALAGFGFWTFPIITPALFALAFVILGCMGLRLAGPRVWLGGLSGFAVGSAPLWIWNILNGWQTFRLGTAFRFAGLFINLKRVVFGRMPNALWNANVSGRAVFVIPAVMAVFVLIFLLWAVFAKSENRRFVRASAAGILLYTVFHLVMLAGSHFVKMDTSRYVLPLIPVFAVVIGSALTVIARNGFLQVVSGILLLGTIVPQFKAFENMREVARLHEAQSETVHQLADFLRERDITSVYAYYVFSYANFMLGEEIVFSDLRGERYRPYAMQNEMSDNIAVLQNFGQMSEFLAYSGGGAETASLNDMFRLVHYNFVPPCVARERVPKSDILSIADDTGVNVKPLLSDNNISTVWTDPNPDSASALLVKLKEPVEIVGIRLLSTDWTSYPGRWILEGRLGDDGVWRALTSADAVSYFFWSGPRPFWAGNYYRMECGTPPVMIDQLRMTRTWNRPGWRWSISELDVFRKCAGSGETITEQEAFPLLMEKVLAGNVRRLYCDRWVANKTHEFTCGAIETGIETARGDISDSPWQRVEMDEGTAIVVRMEDAPATRETLVSAGCSVKEEVVGPWMIFQLDGESSGMECRGVSLHWAGFGCLKTSSF